AEDGIRDKLVTGVQTCALPISYSDKDFQPRQRCKRRLRRIQAEPKVLVAVGGVEIGGLVPVRIPARADLRAALVFAQADRRHVRSEERRVGKEWRMRWAR